MKYLESGVTGRGSQHPLYCLEKVRAWFFVLLECQRFCDYHSSVGMSLRGYYWCTKSCRIVVENSSLFTHFNRGVWKHFISRPHCSTGVLHRFFSSLMNESWKWRWREENVMKLQYCSKLGSRWQGFLQQYAGLTLRLPWLLLSFLICFSLMLFWCNAFLQGNAIKMCGFRHSCCQENFPPSLLTPPELINWLLDQ